jgi:hypothetical protein
MTEPRLKPSELPGWPRWLSEDLAAAYVGVSQTTFRHEIAAGVWPKPRRAGRHGGRNVWDRHSLDRASDELSNPSRIEKEQMLKAVRGKI